MFGGLFGCFWRVFEGVLAAVGVFWGGFVGVLIVFRCR